MDHISDILDDRTLMILRSITGGSIALLEPKGRQFITRAITPYRELTIEDAKFIGRLVCDINSWHFARKRCIPKATARIKIDAKAGNAVIDLGMYCQDWRIYTDTFDFWRFFDPVADQIRGILKRSFPEYASPNPDSMWRSGVIKELVDMAVTKEEQQEKR